MNKKLNELFHKTTHPVETTEGSESIDTPGYEPFGPDWEKELMKMPKKALIDLIRKIKLGL